MNKQNRGKRGIRMGVVVLLAIIALLAAVLAFRLAYRGIVGSSHRIAAPGIDEDGMVEIGGIQQYINIRGENMDNPAILFLHGGPGSPITAMLHGYQYDWEKDFTIVNWDQRSAGKTFFANDKQAVKQTMTFERMLMDAKEVSDYVRKRLNKDKIIILGHSWGSVLGTALVQTYPEDFSAYIGVGQVVNMMENERVGYEAALAAAEDAGNQKDVAALQQLQGYPGTTYTQQTFQDLMKVREYQAKYDLGMSINAEMVWLSATSPYYSAADVRFYMMDTHEYTENIIKAMFEQFDAHNYGVAYSIPVYYIMGENDYQTPITLAREFFGEIDAPGKQFYEIPDAGHFTMLDNKREFTRVLREIRKAV